ncbi:MAG: L-rhamnose isomerase [Planctomycetota bacterium]
MTNYDSAKQQYADLGVDTEAAIATLLATPISLHCWQGDDVAGFENTGGTLGSGLAVTGNFPGAATTPEQLRADTEQVLKLLPGKHRFNLHAIYLDTDDKVERDAIEPKHFQSWIDWAKANDLHGLDFNPTCFAHPHADDGFTLSHPDAGVRDFWVRHCQASRKIGAAMGQAMGTTTVTNVWIPDGYKDSPADRMSPRQRLIESLDRVFEEKLDPAHHLDAVESKLFGIGSESYVVGSHEFYLGYAFTRSVVPTLDAGHFHPTECISEKISAVMLFADHLLLHVSRGVRWDSDHVVTRNDATSAICRELVRCGVLDKTHLGLDFFDASINRIAAWTIGTQATQKALLAALLEPADRLIATENEGDFTSRLALQEHARDLPLGDVWDEACRRSNVPEGVRWLDEVKRYEADVLSKR